MTTSRVTGDEFRRTVREVMPGGGAPRFEVVTLERGRAVLRMPTGPSDLRPGDTVAGPVLFQLADLAMFAVVMSAIGNVPLAVTTDATIHFMRRPPSGTLIARAKILKEGRRLIVGDVTISREEDGPGEIDAPVAHAVMTYSVPVER